MTKVYVWKCVVCENEILPEEAIEDPTEKWFVECVSIMPDNKIIKGKFNILGMLGNETIFEEGREKPEVYHEFCYRNSGSPSKYSKPSENSDIKEFIELFQSVKVVNDLKKYTYESVSKEIKETGDSSNLTRNSPRINGEGTKIEDYKILEDAVNHLCVFDIRFGTHSVLQSQAKIQRFFAKSHQPSIEMAEKFNPVLKPYFEEIVDSNLKIAEILENASLEVKALTDNINKQLELAYSVDAPKVSHENLAQIIAGSIKDRGWAVMTITGEIPFAYTIGLYKNFKHPEIVVMAIDGKQASSLLNYLGEQIKEGKRFEVGKTYEKEEGLHRHVFLKVENKYRQDYFGKAIEFYNGLLFPVIQRVTADKQEIFPWEEGCDPVLKFAQKILGKVELTNN